MTRLSEAVELYQGVLEEQLDRIEKKVDSLIKVHADLMAFADRMEGKTKQYNRQDKEKRIKDTMKKPEKIPCVHGEYDYCEICKPTL